MTRISKATAILLLGAGMSLFAADTAATANTDQTVQTQSGDQTTQASSNGAQAQADSGINVEIQKIMQADPSDRRALMNQFKQKLATMNQNDRMEAISQLRSAMQTEGMHQAQSHMQQGDQMAQEGMTMGHHAMKSGMSMGQMSHGNGAMQESGDKPDMGSMQQHGGMGHNMPTMVSQSDTSSHQAPAAQPATPAVPAQPAPATQPSNGVPQTAPTPNMAVQPTMPSATAQTGVRSHSGGAMGMNMMGHR